MRVSKHGMTIIEVLIACVVLAVGIMVIISSFSMNLRESVQSREHLMGALVMENLLEEVLAHPYGEPAPGSWNEGPIEFEVVVEGKPIQTKYSQSVVKSEKGAGNGSFFDSGKSNSTDVVTLKVSWSEASGTGSSAVPKTLATDLTVKKTP